MLLNPPSRRGSYSIPIYINLQSARRRQGRELMSSFSAKEARNKGERAKAQATVSSVGEDRATLLGLSMVGFAVLMYFLFGIILVHPYLQSKWTEESNCTTNETEILLEWADTAGQSNYPCLRVSVNLSNSGQMAELYYNEDIIHQNPKCFYIPKHRQNKSDLVAEVDRIQRYLLENCSLYTCYSSPEEYPGEAILKRKYNGWLVLWYMSWPSLMLAGGVMTISLVKLTQRLSQMCAQLSTQGSESAD
ncbi:calcium-activated potassium channel subunit beta-3 [Megalops cyprinoides]|uniref:calcium-activated potassium channel subunit beta-3 n=1 Tax=Megalops cyprinoides TaxID=118141 RepID=UPI00186494DB|nr:calcium-activated potassium channel subunit beta-3 [Megalops cyprinoides]